MEEDEMEEPQTLNHEHGHWTTLVAGGGKRRCPTQGKQHVPTRIPVMTQEGGKTRVFLQEDVDNAWDVPEHMTRS